MIMQRLLSLHTLGHRKICIRYLEDIYTHHNSFRFIIRYRSTNEDYNIYFYIDNVDNEGNI